MDNPNSNQNNLGGSSSNDDNDTNFITQQNYTIKKKTVKKSNKITNHPLNAMKTFKTLKVSQWQGDTFDNEMNDEEYIEQRKKDKILKMIKNAHIEKRKNYIFLKEINNAHDQIQRFSQLGETAEAKEMERELNTLTSTVIQSNIDAFTKTKLAKSHAALYGQSYNTIFKDKNYTTNKNIRNLSKSERVINDERIYSSTIKKSVNKKNYEENEEIEETEEEEETKTRKRKKNKKKDTKKKKKNKTLDNNNKGREKISMRNIPHNISEFKKLFNNQNRNQYPNQSQNPNQFGYPNQFINSFPNQNPNFQGDPNQFTGLFPNQNPNLQGDPNQFMGPYSNQNQNPNLQGYPNQFINTFSNQNPNPNLQGHPNQFTNNSQKPKQNPNLRGYPNKKINNNQNPDQNNSHQNRNPNEYPNNSIPNGPYYNRSGNLQPQINERYDVYNVYDQNQINKEINDNTSEELSNKKKKKKPSNKQPPNNNNPLPESQDENDSDNNNLNENDDFEEEPEEERKEEGKSPEEENQEQPNQIDTNLLFSQTVSSTVTLKNPDIQSKLVGSNQIPNQKDIPSSTVEIKLNYPIPEDKNDSPKTIEPNLDNHLPINPLQEKENPETNKDLPKELKQKINPNKKPNDRINRPPYSPEQNPKLEAANETGPKKRNLLSNPPYQYPNQYPPNQIYPLNQENIPYPNNYPENPNINPYYPYPNQKPKRQRPKPKQKPKSLTKNYPKKSSPNYYPNRPFVPERQYEDSPEEILKNRNPNLVPQKQKMKRPKSSKGPIINPSVPYIDKYEYPRRYRNPPYNPGRSLSRSKSRSFSKEERKSPSTVPIPFAYPTSGKCFACDVKCSISRSGNSPNKYVPYFASYKKLRKDITYYDGEKYGYYQNASRFPENDEIFNMNNY